MPSNLPFSAKVKVITFPDQQDGSDAFCQPWWPEFDSHSHMVEGRNYFPQAVPWPPHNAPMCTHTMNTYMWWSPYDIHSRSKMHTLYLKDLCVCSLSIWGGWVKQSLAELVFFGLMWHHCRKCWVDMRQASGINHRSGPARWLRS